ncbi:nuclear RNA export factor 1-like [Gigantopelta aegis]|uniref:nuclear RNA export factor 1-like n=1 Tax=Gigantopelta aegis TaxID=1735272 RepID=UPI001B88AC30|nr:nuclear RNA export factor 1-like [Gigantopelta aegis]
MSSLTVTAGRDGSRSFGGHDDRWSGKQRNQRRGRGKSYYSRGSYNRGGNKGPRGGGVNPRSRFTDEDDDVNMDSSSGHINRRFDPYGQGGGWNRRNRGRGSFKGGRYHGDFQSHKDTGAMQRMGLPVSRQNQWYKITIPHGKKTGKDEILKLINSVIGAPFQPVYFHYQNKDALFYVKDWDQATALRRTSKMITLPSGFKMIVVVSPCSPPVIPMDKESIEKLQKRMSERYDPASKCLDLSSLYQDEVLSASGLYLALNRANTMSNVVKIIQENIPELVGLDLSSNRLLSLSHMTDLVSAAPFVTKLNIGKNQLRSIEELQKIEGWKLLQLVLDGNDLCDRYKERSEYISMVRKRFPKVINLDGHELPPPITFDLETTTVIPPSKGSYFMNDEVKTIVVKFLKEYYTIYDSDNRQPLFEAYHEQAVFCIATAYNGTLDYKQPSLTDYLQESRNIFRVKDTARREKSIKNGRLPVVSQLCLLPKTTHDPNSFVVDINIVRPTLLSFSLTGIFKETESKSDKPPIRAFNRLFVTVPCGSGMVITNDVLTITNASPEQSQSAFKSTGPTPSSSPVSSAPPAVPSTSLSPIPGTSAVPNKEMIQRFSAESGMNAEWSHKCLEENGWNYKKAALVFTELHSQGKIPQDAFVK